MPVNNLHADWHLLTSIGPPVPWSPQQQPQLPLAASADWLLPPAGLTAQTGVQLAWLGWWPARPVRTGRPCTRCCVGE
jgi:hypothetical protein